MREAFAADLLGAASFTHKVDKLDPVRIDAPKHRRRDQKGLSPGLFPHVQAARKQ
jgi:hypothetical protein